MALDDFNTLYQLALSLALGLVIGIEREWRERDFDGERRPAGLRTFGLIGLSGGVSGLAGRQFEAMPAIGLAITILVMLVAYWRRSSSREFMGVTTIFAAFVAFACGVLCIMGTEVPAIAGAIVVAMILGAKDRMHGFVGHLDQKEIFAALQFLLIAGVALPLIPNERMGPYNAINPFEIWLMAVLISGLSFSGYIALRTLGARHGILGTAILGGFVSSTAVTVSLAHMARRQPELHNLLSVGIITASTIMFARVAAIAAIVHTPLLGRLAPPIACVIIISIICATFIARKTDGVSFEKPKIANPLDVAPAILFAGLLGIIMVSSRALEALFGPEGVYAISIASGLADVDAITLTLSRFAAEGLSVEVASIGILLAAVTNTFVKVALAAFAGGSSLRPAFLSLSAAIIAAGLSAVITM
ncbi:MAG: MgtC/SapB family protein [Marinicaulis sp.]|nr:MgtC/SapB family protein [Marinicaulis sp.]NNL89618.1 MgtC/SapB family protein [Marinicaulis sp.]